MEYVQSNNPNTTAHANVAMVAFQEGFLAKRRLVFTDSGAAYICNSGSHSQTEHENTFETYLLKFMKCIPRGKIGLQGAQALMMNYTERTLSFDGDALNAITGALDTLSTNEKKPVYHIWGVLFRPTDSPEHAELHGNTCGLRFCLFWAHPCPCRRRADFPSWSPLGWSGVVDWPDDSATPLPGDIKVEVWAGNAYQELQYLVSRGGDLQHLSSTQESQSLRITARTVPFRKVFVEWDVRDPDSCEWCLRVELDSHTHILVRIVWDHMESELAYSSASGLCLVATNPYRQASTSLFVVESAGRYERIGVLDEDFWLDGHVALEGNRRRQKSISASAVLRYLENLSEEAEERTFLLR